MSFWKDPQYSSIRVLIIVVLVIVAGYFAYKYENKSGENTGRVIDTSVQGAASKNTITQTTGDSVTVNGMTLVKGQTTTITAKSICKPGNYPTLHGGCVTLDGNCNPTAWSNQPCSSNTTTSAGGVAQ